MRILIASDTYYPSVDGASIFTQRLVVKLKERGHELMVIAPSTSFKDGYVTANGITVFGVSSWPTLFHKNYRFTPPIRLSKKIRPVIKKFNPDVTHIQGHFFIESTVAKLSRKLNIPILATNHFMPENLIHYLHAPVFIENIVTKLAWMQFKLVFDRLPSITTPTRTAAKVLKDIGIKQDVLPLSCGIDLTKFSPSNDGEFLRQKYHLPNIPLVLCVGRLAPEKHIDKILKACANALQKTSFHLTIAGNGLEKENLIKLAAELGISDNVSFLGFVPDDDLPFLYPLASLFIMAGTVELQSLVTMEAMACGVPVLAANALALPELVHSGENGFLFNPESTEDIATYVEKIIANPELQSSMANKSLELIKVHDINDSIRRFESLYESLIKDGYEQ